ncbi:MAG: Lrp/AsnC ligand binding domain-containing protein [Thaumarchaeota archaeon]|nr:Lrp/AsnC ligand binding domain-containing protein [Nitrososphaerota archaeon]
MLQVPQLGKNTETTCVMINCESGAESGIIDEIKSIPGVKESVRTSGPYDILAMIESNTVESLKEIIENRIRKIPQIRATTTLVIASQL